MSLIIDKFVLCSDEQRKYFKVRHSFNTGGKAGKGLNKTRSFSVIGDEFNTWPGYISYIPGDNISERKALARAHNGCKTKLTVEKSEENNKCVKAMGKRQYHI